MVLTIQKAIAHDLKVEPDLFAILSILFGAIVLTAHRMFQLLCKYKTRIY